MVWVLLYYCFVVVEDFPGEGGGGGWEAGD